MLLSLSLLSVPVGLKAHFILRAYYYDFDNRFFSPFSSYFLFHIYIFCINNNNNNNSSNSNNVNSNIMSNRRYLQCPALVTIAHLKKFLALKYSVDMTRYTIEICHRRAPLPEHWTLMDVAYIYAWKRVRICLPKHIFTFTLLFIFFKVFSFE